MLSLTDDATGGRVSLAPRGRVAIRVPRSPATLDVVRARLVADLIGRVLTLAGTPRTVLYTDDSDDVSEDLLLSFNLAAAAPPPDDGVAQLTVDVGVTGGNRHVVSPGAVTWEGAPGTPAEAATRGVDPLALRLALLDHPYRESVDLRYEDLRAAQARLRRWRELLAEWAERPSKPMCAAYVETTHAALEDDLDTPRVLATMWELETDGEPPPGAKMETFLHLDQVLGLELPRRIGQPR